MHSDESGAVPSDTRRAVAARAVDLDIDIPERVGYRIKRTLLGRPLASAEMHGEKLPKTLALGVLSSDCISSSAYGTEEMLVALIGVFGLSAFHILMPMTAVIIGVLILMTLSYREVVMVYTKIGGSYVVARENLGPRIAQIAAVALMIDYIVTVAVQSAAGTAAITSAASGLRPYSKEITIAVVLVLVYGNLRGIREAGKAFAFPTYFFFGSMFVVIVVGVVREVIGDLPQYAIGRADQLEVLNKHHAVFSGAAIYVLLKAFANGGASLTGLEAISDGVSAFKEPTGRNARRTLSYMSLMLGFLVIGVSYLAMETHAAPFQGGSPTVISQVAKAAFGDSIAGHFGFVLVQAATALILFTGANTPFTGFPFLTSFVAGDSFLPRQLTRRGHRLAFSNGIIVLSVLAIALLLAVGANVDALVPFYAIGVFTGFTMAGWGMARYHSKHRGPNWRRRWAVNFSGGTVSCLVVLIFAVVKFTEGAWLVVILFPIGWFALVRLNKQYRAEERSLDLATWVRQDQAGAPHYGRHTVLVLVDRLDLAVLRGLRYAGSLRPTEVRAVHVMLDEAVAARLQATWIERGLGDRFPLEIVECPDRRLVRAAAERALDAVVQDRAEVTVLLPRRTYRRLWGRLLHDRTADRIAAAVGRIPHVSATIVPFDTTLPHEAVLKIEERQNQVRQQAALPATGGGTAVTDRDEHALAYHATAPGVTPIGAVARSQRVTVEGRIKIVQAGTVAGKSLEAQLFDETGGLRLLFFGRTRIPGIEPGAIVRVTGRVGEYKGHLALANPNYELLTPRPGPGTPG